MQESYADFELTSEFVVPRQKSRQMPLQQPIGPGQFLRSKEKLSCEETPIECDYSETQLTEKEMDAIRQLVRDSKNTHSGFDRQDQ